MLQLVFHGLSKDVVVLEKNHEEILHSPAYFQKVKYEHFENIFFSFCFIIV